ncbi:alpha/beta hydrolase [Aquamicrobium segne]|uniref:Alpha/beta hydrolase n=1 Tax=Aquamicrobium segne TaxID=469547 RepID=A0ABW0H1B2_9HYPH
MRAALTCLSMLLLMGAAWAQSLVLKPYKDELFAYPALVSAEADLSYRVVDYRELRDINGRDEIPERRAKRAYVSTGVRKVQKDLALKTNVGTIRHFAVGRTKNASMIVLYLHGQGGSRRQGVDDFTFGGNFNRIKNLMAQNGGLYLSPDFSDFDARGAAEISALIQHYASQSPHAKIFVACGSMGGALCWKLAGNRQDAQQVDGLLLLGSLWDEGFLSSPGFLRRIPVFFAQGSRDSVFAVEKQEAFFRAILKKQNNYPARFVRFETGSHGTPIRMTDWRETLNWMLSVAK